MPGARFGPTLFRTRTYAVRLLFHVRKYSAVSASGYCLFPNDHAIIHLSRETIPPGVPTLPAYQPNPFDGPFLYHAAAAWKTRAARSPAGGPCLKYSDGWFYLLADLALPRRIYTSYLLRTKDFETWYVGYYNPIIMPSDDDRKISPHYTEITEAEALRLKTAFHVNNTDLDVCEWQGKTYINYACGNQLGNYWMAEAVCDMPLADFLKSYFE